MTLLLGLKEVYIAEIVSKTCPSTTFPLMPLSCRRRIVTAMLTKEETNKKIDEHMRKSNRNIPNKVEVIDSSTGGRSSASKFFAISRKQNQRQPRYSKKKIV